MRPHATRREFVAASGIALSMLSVIALTVFLKKALQPLLSEKVVFTAFSAVGLLFSVFILYSFFFLNDSARIDIDRNEKKITRARSEIPTSRKD